MSRPGVSVTSDFLRSRLILPAAIAYILSAIAGLAGVVLLFWPNAGPVMVQDMLLSGITDSSALKTWQFINTVITVLCFLWAAILSICLICALGKRADQALNLMYHASRLCVWSLNAVGICLAVLFVYRLTAYLIGTFNLNEWVYLIYAMLVSEALMVVLAWLLFRMLRNFMNCLCDSAASMGYTVSSGTLSQPTIPGFTATGFLLLGIAGVVVFIDRLFTLTIVQSFPQDYYAILTTEHPLLIFSGLSFIFGSVGSFFISFYLRRYKHKCEWLLYKSQKG